MGRAGFWLYAVVPTLAVYAFCLLVYYLLSLVTHSDAAGYGAVYLGLLWVFPWAMVASKRVHDMGSPAWLVLVFLVPILNIFFAFNLLFVKGESGDNRFGPDPLGDGSPTDAAS
jgi:uncharacterized membrane protein YhaH (DUF805 family)